MFFFYFHKNNSQLNPNELKNYNLYIFTFNLLNHRNYVVIGRNFVQHHNTGMCLKRIGLSTEFRRITCVRLCVCVCVCERERDRACIIQYDFLFKNYEEELNVLFVVFTIHHTRYAGYQLKIASVLPIIDIIINHT
jgi:hypothetical protein